ISTFLMCCNMILGRIQATFSMALRPILRNVYFSEIDERDGSVPGDLCRNAFNWCGRAELALARVAARVTVSLESLRGTSAQFERSS
ncbi:hypothetical protein BC826DRAFT_1068766, partial [Russula brevipes]